MLKTKSVIRPELIIADSYSTARDQFLSSADAHGAEIKSYHNTGIQGLNGESLHCDVAVLGPQNAKKKLIVSSGTHGIEGYCGSMVQRELLGSGALEAAVESVCVLIVHAINPYGFSHFRRVNEDNIDVNRNFIDFTVPIGDDIEYEEFRHAVFPKHWKGSDLSRINKAVSDYTSKHGMHTFQRIFTKGQYQFADDPYFGGTRESWSRTVWQEICRDVAFGCNVIAHIDIHTGLGKFGACELIYGGQPHPKNVETAIDWHGEEFVKVPGDSSLSGVVSGAISSHMDSYPLTNIAVGMEFGTVPLPVMLSALIADNWRAFNIGADSELEAQIRREMKSAFFSRNQGWLNDIWKHSVTHVSQAIEKLTNI